MLADYVTGDASALSRLVELHRPGVSRFARRQLGSRRAWADNVTQDVVVRLPERSSQPYFTPGFVLVATGAGICLVLWYALWLA